VRDGIADSIDETRAYVAAEAGPMFNPVVVDSYLANAHMVETYAAFPFMQFVVTMRAWIIIRGSQEQD
jgi:hypothetical protein